jgi:hypothetical protein
MDDGSAHASVLPPELLQLIQQQVAQATADLHNQLHRLQHAPPPASVATPKPARPKLYSGARGEDPAPWIFQFEQYASLARVSNEQYTILAGTYLEKTAATWWQGIVTERNLLSQPLPTWDVFKTLLVANFQPINAAKVARDRLAELRQIGSVDKYNADFRRLILEAGNVSPTEQLDRYVRGLKPKVRMEVELSSPVDLTNAMTQAQRVDNITWSLRSYDHPRGSYSTAPQHAPMELGALQHTSSCDNPSIDLNATRTSSNRQVSPQRYAPSVSKEEFDRCRRLGLCLRCKKTGHTARFCLEKSSDNPSSSNTRPNHTSQQENGRAR